MKNEENPKSNRMCYTISEPAKYVLSLLDEKHGMSKFVSEAIVEKGLREIDAEKLGQKFVATYGVRKNLDGDKEQTATPQAIQNLQDWMSNKFDTVLASIEKADKFERVDQQIQLFDQALHSLGVLMVSEHKKQAIKEVIVTQLEEGSVSPKEKNNIGMLRRLLKRFFPNS